ncbi:class I SAM-dependent methyltransferase [Massilia sp. Dwa41.01b]|uniref:methyltransferase n=1 Tax=Massilia sp. Dwa41.01b TaxID=2709302 RepID=UPI001E56EAB4|nr:class I SAM-dependent methyltransferase [Massilia sp. Dwa41.01b]
MTQTTLDFDALLALGQALQDAGYRFTTVTPATHRRVNGREENARARDLRGVFGWSRPFREDTLPAHIFALMRRAGVVSEREASRGGGLCATVRASTIGERLYFHSRFPTSDDDAVFFGPDTYRYIAAAQRAMTRLATPGRAVDIGAGSGAGAIEVAARFPEAQVVAADINARALELAAVNARLAGTARVETRHSDLLKDLDGGFDLVLSNPPTSSTPTSCATATAATCMGPACRWRSSKPRSIASTRAAPCCSTRASRLSTAATNSATSLLHAWTRPVRAGRMKSSTRTFSAASSTAKATRTWNGSRLCGCKPRDALDQQETQAYRRAVVAYTHQSCGLILLLEDIALHQFIFP